MFSQLTMVFRHPASRRKWLTIASGTLIAAALGAWYGFGAAAPWAPLMTLAAILAGYDIALRAWARPLARVFCIRKARAVRLSCQLQTHLVDFMPTCSYARSLKTLGGVTPNEYTCSIGNAGCAARLQCA